MPLIIAVGLASFFFGILLSMMFRTDLPEDFTLQVLDEKSKVILAPNWGEYEKRWLENENYMLRSKLTHAEFLLSEHRPSRCHPRHLCSHEILNVLEENGYIKKK